MTPSRVVAPVFAVVLALVIPNAVRASLPICTSNADCTDNTICTNDVCDSETGLCSHSLIDCDDTNRCTIDDCDLTEGCTHVPIDCRDDNPCSDDFCSSELGCYYTLHCDDHDECTTDSCDATGACQHVALDCNDGDACTIDTCSDGVCQRKILDCGEDDGCTDRDCDRSIGCTATPVSCDDHNFCTDDSCNVNDGCHNDPITCDDDDPCTENICDETVAACRYVAISCDDGDPCTVDNACDRFLGCVHTPIDCDDHDACTVDTCEATGCGHTPLPSCAGPPDLNDFQCYKTQRPSVGRKGVALEDQFGASTVTVKRARRLCAPANSNSGDPEAVNAAGHLTSYTMRQTDPHVTGETGVKVVNQFGELTVDLMRPERLLVPTAKSLTAPPGPLTEDLDHFKCYRVRSGGFRKKGIVIETQFGQKTVDIIRPRHLCAPANKNGETPGAEDHALHLMCYQVRTTSQGSREVFTKNQFGDDHYDIIGLRELCVASFKNPGTCGNGAIDAPGELCDPPGAVCGSDGRVCSATCTCPALPVCGDGTCNGTEDTCSCPDDCGASSCATCGCNADDHQSCQCDPECHTFGDCCADACAVCGGCCGDGTCDPGEDTCNCALDCGATTCAACGCGLSLSQSCQCDAGCVDGGDCCGDACSACGACP